jgi:hypothetical protein
MSASRLVFRLLRQAVWSHHADTTEAVHCSKSVSIVGSRPDEVVIDLSN